MSPADRRRCRHLVYGVVRHLGLLDACVQPHLVRPPRPVLRAALLTGAFEILENPPQAPAIIHHAVDRAREVASPAEARVVNAVLRKVVGTLAAATAVEPAPGDVAALARRHSHPRWLVERWLGALGEEATRQLLLWNQSPAPVHARVAAGDEVHAGQGEAPASFRSTRWPAYFLLDRPDWSEVERLLAAGRIYLQDPATSVAPDLLAVQPGEVVLDVCAAPGGKTLQLAEAAGPGGRVVAVDLPGLRLERLRENLRRYRAVRDRVKVVACDGRELSPAILAAEKQPRDYDAVLLDAPCSNTGVLRHRVDAKWRLGAADLVELPKLQLALLTRAATLVRPGGRLVYSTCSLEPEENTGVVDAFLASREGETFTLAQARASRPWADGCDGAGAFLLRRRTTS
ncbi:MAG: RNA methyltransferase [Opitutaceae bacterium]|nr:RNA methyltransferase [Opitutaceae bacterium]